MKIGPKSDAALQRALKSLPGGVNSPVRAYGSVGGNPPFIARGKGAFIDDIDGHEYIDYVLSWGLLILGHAHPAVYEAVIRAVEKGASFGAPTEAETELVELVKQAMPHMELLRLVNSGTEAVMTAIRLARAFTGRDLIVKFEGCYHGHSDAMLVKAGSGVATGGIPGTRGVPTATAAMTLSLPFNNLEAVIGAFERHGSRIAAVIVEPIAANMGVILPRDGFLPLLRDLATQHGACLIFDEVITGFRVARGGASELYKLVPDIVCLGKILGGGLPIGAVGGSREILQLLAPSGDVYQAGTLSGNPVCVAAGVAALKELQRADFYINLKSATQRLALGLMSNFAQAGIPVQINFATGLLTAFFSSDDVKDYASAAQGNANRFSQFFCAMLDAGIYLPPSPYEAWFLSDCHTPEIISQTLTAQSEALKQLH